MNLPHPPDPAKPSPGRITVVEMVYFQSSGDQPIAVDSRFARDCATDEQPFTRPSFSVGEEWVSVPSAWLDEAGMLVLVNLTGRGQHVVPTPRQRQVFADAVVELGVADGVDTATYKTAVVPFAYVPAGESCRLSPVSFRSLRLRCRKGEARCNVTVMPV